MNPILKSSLLGLVAAGALASAPALAQKIGVVDYAQLMQEAPQAKVALDKIRTEFAPKERELQAAQQTLNTKQEKFQKDQATMSADQRGQAEKELRDGYRDLERSRQEVQDDFNARRNEELSRLQRTLIEEVRTYAKAQSFDLVLAEGVIYATPAMDITAGVLQNLKGRAPAGTP